MILRVKTLTPSTSARKEPLVSHTPGQHTDADAQHLATIVEASSDAIVGRTLEGIITSWNRGAEQVYGYSAHEMIGKSSAGLLPSGVDDGLPQMIARLRRQERVEPYETTRLRKDGVRIDVSISVSAIRDANGELTGVGTIARDITESRRTEDSLEQRIAFEDLVATISSSFANMTPEDSDAGITDALAAIGAFSNVDRSYVFLFSADQTRMDNTHEWCAPGIESQLHRLRNAPVTVLPSVTAKVLLGEVAYVPSVDDLAAESAVDAVEARAQGIQSFVLVPIMSRGVAVGFLGFDAVRSQRSWSAESIRLLTIVGQVLVTALERRWATKVLQQQESRYRRIFDATSDGLIISDPDTGLVLDANPAMCRMHGYEPEEFIGLHRRDFIHPDSHHLLPEYVRKVLAGDEEYRIRAMDRRKDGSSFHVEVHGAPVILRGKRVILGVVRDISNDVEAIEILEQRVAERTQDLSTLLEITRTVASTLALQPVLQIILDQLKSVVDYSNTSILALEHDELVFVGRQGRVSDTDLPRLRYPIAEFGGLWERFAQGEPINIPDVRAVSDEAQIFRNVVGNDTNEALHFMRSCMLVPLVVMERTIGLLSIAKDQPNAFTPRHIELATAIARQAAVAIEYSRMVGQAQGKAALEERQKLARELHDSVSQALYGIALGAQTARTLLDRDPMKAKEPMDYVLSLAEAGLAEMRALIFELRPESLETEGLVEALKKQTAALHARYQLDVNLEVEREPQASLDVKEALYRIAQEALHNTVKHARATNAGVRLTFPDGAILLEISDNGQGFDSSGSFPGHLGLHSMRERAERLGGTLELQSSPGCGTAIRVRIPAKPDTRRRGPQCGHS